MVSVTDVAGTARSYQAKPLIPTWLVGAGLACSEFLALAGASPVAGAAYHIAYYGEFHDVASYLLKGALVGLFFVLFQALREQYRPAPNASYWKNFAHTFLNWNFTFAAFLLVAFLTKTSAEISRGFAITFYFAGFAAVAGVRLAFIAAVRRGFHSGWLVQHRVLIVGLESEIRSFERRYDPSRSGLRIADVITLTAPSEPNPDALAAAAVKAVNQARALDVEDVLLLLPWSYRGAIDRLAEAFLSVPASIHLGPEHDLVRFGDIAVSRLANVPCLRLERAPLSRSKRLVKRLLDLAVASVALILLAPILLLVAVLIRLDSPGPALFFQRRLGFNNRVFRIIKFRTMTTLEDDMTSQATADDVRLTRLGRVLRRWNIDELPQLLNVLAGSMSIVGPRPHALKMDGEYQQKIALYARRHNVKPGITGWAQINGLRGLTDSNEKMEARVEHDLFYIENWSLWLDVHIMLMTLISPSAYRNAG
jgi:Undecaprenyl-phosphate glucose phosphotransferase